MTSCKTLLVLVVVAMVIAAHGSDGATARAKSGKKPAARASPGQNAPKKSAAPSPSARDGEEGESDENKYEMCILGYRIVISSCESSEDDEVEARKVMTRIATNLGGELKSRMQSFKRAMTSGNFTQQ